MGKRGPQKTPTRILTLRGSWRAKARGAEPTPDPSPPACPAWLSPVARRAWRRLVPQLRGMSLLGSCDRNALARYCTLFARWRDAEEYLHENGSVYEEKAVVGIGKHSQVVVKAFKEYPQARLAARLADQLLRLEHDFGLTPSARAGLAKPAAKPDENRGKARFFKAMNSA